MRAIGIGAPMRPQLNLHIEVLFENCMTATQRGAAASSAARRPAPGASKSNCGQGRGQALPEGFGSHSQQFFCGPGTRVRDCKSCFVCVMYFQYIYIYTHRGQRPLCPHRRRRPNHEPGNTYPQTLTGLWSLYASAVKEKGLGLLASQPPGACLLLPRILFCPSGGRCPNPVGFRISNPARPTRNQVLRKLVALISKGSKTRRWQCRVRWG